LVEYRFAGGDSADRIRTLAAELLATRPDVIVAHGSACALALARETRTIPIIFVLVSDPVGSGLALSLAEPGGNATGFSNFAPPMSTKWVEFLKAFSPQLARVVLLVNPESPGGSQFLRPVEAAARSFAMESVLARVSNAAQIENALAAASHNPGSGLIVMPHIFASQHRELITALARRHALPAVYPFRYFAEAGGLISYGIDVPDLFRRAAHYVNQVLRGAKPSNLPVQQPDRFELVINMKTAKSLGLDVPRILLVRANEVIE